METAYIPIYTCTCTSGLKMGRKELCRVGQGAQGIIVGNYLVHVSEAGTTHLEAFLADANLLIITRDDGYAFDKCFFIRTNQPESIELS